MLKIREKLLYMHIFNPILYHNIQEGHPDLGLPYTGTNRTAFLPNNDQGQKVAKLLRLAFDAGLVFTIGTSITPGAPNLVMWNGIHHKTQPNGSP